MGKSIVVLLDTLRKANVSIFHIWPNVHDDAAAKQLGIKYPAKWNLVWADQTSIETHICTRQYARFDISVGAIEGSSEYIETQKNNITSLLEMHGIYLSGMGASKGSYWFENNHELKNLSDLTWVYNPED